MTHIIRNMKRKRLRNYIPPQKNILCVLLIIVVFVLYKMNKTRNYEDIKSKLYKSAVKYIEFKEQIYENTLQIDTLKKIIEKCNQEERILNQYIYGPLKPEAPVMVIFVDRFKENFKFLVASLHHVVGIANVLIIFAHSYFDENVNVLIKTIDFARFMQIFYPYSLQICPKQFPGYQPGDCTRDMSMDIAKKINCTGANYPDIHERYRDPVLAQTKHFWWWTMNQIFEKISHTKSHNGMFIFLDDDLFLMQDFLYMTFQMNRISKLISNCDFISLHTTGEPKFYETKADSADIRTWNPEQHSSVLAFHSRVWNTIAAHYYLFCDFDDYSWSRTLFYMSLNRKDGDRFKVISSTMPRAFKTSALSSVYDQFQEYTILNTVNKILEMEKRYHGNLFPDKFKVFLDIELEFDDFVSFDYVENNGRWSDPRDIKMCANLTENKIRKIILDMNSQFNHYRNDDDIFEDSGMMDIEVPGG